MSLYTRSSKLWKTYAVSNALIGNKILTISGGGTGQYDKLSPATYAIIIDDDTTTNIINMTDNYICQAYRRQNNNPIWGGQYFIFTSNLKFEEWVKACGITDSRQIKALQSRFYISHVTDLSKFICDSPSKRGTIEEQIKRKDLFMKLATPIQESICSYQKYLNSQNAVDYSDLPGYNPFN